MELRQLKYFIKVAEMLNFSAASKELFISQSTLSQQVSQLERELGQQLFQRTSHEVMLTEAGQILLPLARETVNAADNCLLRLHELEKLLTGELNIGVTFSFSSIAAETLIDFLKKYPKVKVKVRYAPMSELISKLLSRELDLVLAFKPLEIHEQIESHVLFHNRLAAIVNEYHPLAKQESVKLEELKKYNFALPIKGLQARNAFDKMTEGSGLHYNIKVEINSINLLFDIIRNSNYVTILSESTVINESGLRVIPIVHPANHMEGCIHTLKDTYIKHSVRVFIEMLTQSTEVLKKSFFL